MVMMKTMKIKFRTDDEEEFDIELKPCPFCGNENIELLCMEDHHTKTKKVTVRCRNCEVEKTTTGAIGLNTKFLVDNIVQWWNNRFEKK